MDIENQRKLKSQITSGNTIDAIQELQQLEDLSMFMDGRTALGYAVSYNNIEVAKFLLKNGANPDLSEIKPDTFTPLMWAAEGNDLEMIQLLLEHGADVRRKNKYNNATALWKTVIPGSLEAAKLLVSAGANPFEEIAAGKSIYDAVKEINANEFVEYFESVKRGFEK
ncbi:ankyrin repeat domain-containing protein [Chryseobacterium formosus]|uniref:Ankyrin repeat domain-containing protein n=1 Tax=Chryseobacterium formosus TaxID=1537363 RepID=A0ABT3XTR5_9FLAO|nr:ankyrin repeat domain-containing protein [Chryseobacterium formosus]MCX8524715.1 ankyrin repeat domain-containing protein [Chryseobacterium formosus]